MSQAALGEKLGVTRQLHIRDRQARSRQISLLKGTANGIVMPVQFRGNEQPNSLQDRRGGHFLRAQDRQTQDF